MVSLDVVIVIYFSISHFYTGRIPILHILVSQTLAYLKIISVP